MSPEPRRRAKGAQLPLEAAGLTSRGPRLEPGPGAPLATRMRPRTLEELLGQAHVLAPGSVLRTLVEEDRLRSVILWGPAGTGKTTLALLIARATKAEFLQLSAVTAGVADVRRAVEEGRERLAVSGRRTVLFIDEVHRFSRTQQDALLPGVEEGAVVFVGATTENPYASVTSPLLSRSLLFRLERLSDDDVRAVLGRALTDERGFGGRATAAAGALDEIVGRAEGDARVALNALEAAADRATARGTAEIAVEDALDAMRQRFVRYDRVGDKHYDFVSAFIKSMRGSDPDAALAWLARMIQGGEDPRFIARRMVIFASEDVGVADPGALAVAVAAAQAVEFVGFPEVAYNLAHAAVALALAPKSNAVARAIVAAMREAEEVAQGDVPLHLRQTSAPGGRPLGYGKGYKYPHDHPGGRVEQEYMPAGLEGRRYWRPEPDLEERRRAGSTDEEEGAG